MKCSKLLLYSAVTLFSLTSVCTAQSVIQGPIVRHEQFNPGLDARVNVVPMVKETQGKTYTIVKLPLNATLYYDDVKIDEENFSLTDPNKVRIDPEDGDITAVMAYTATDVDGKVSEPRNIIIRFLGLQISGSAFHDFDGNGKVDGKRVANLDGEALYITLINKEEKVLSSKPLLENGRYTFNNSDGIQPNTNYALIISTKKNAYQSVLPAKWAASGENINSLGKGKDERKDGIIVVHVEQKNIRDIDFGLDIKPLAKDKKLLTQLNPGENTQVPVPALEGSDEENGEKVRYFLSTLPQKATLYDNGKKVLKAGIEIKDTSKLTLDPDNNDQRVEFSYVTADDAGVISSPAMVTMPFVGLSISGYLFNDGDGDARVNGKPISHIDDVPMYITLLNDKNSILASTSLSDEGKYKFDGTHHIRPNSQYTLVLSTQAHTQTAALPEGWNDSGEGIMNVETGNDGSNNGVITVDVTIKDVLDVDFGVNHRPLANDLTVENQLNPGASLQISLPTLSGNDNESGTKLSYTITTLPENATLYYDKEKIDKENFSVADPAKLSIDPENGDKSISFTYVVTDEADITSSPASVSMSFKQLKLSGHLFNDGDGDNDVNGTVMNAPDGHPLYVLLLAKDETLLSAKAIEKDGTYSFNGEDGVRPDAVNFIVLATAPDLKSFGLPAGWNHTGENINNPATGKDRASDGLIIVAIQKSDIENIDFGINQKPNADSKDVPAQLNPGLDTKVVVPTLTGNDRESASQLMYKIASLPTLGTLYYDGMKIDKIGFVIEDQDKLMLDPNNGDKVLLFTYATTDQAGVISDPARVEMTFTGLNISGQIVNDGNGDDKVKGDALSKPDNTLLYVTLLDTNASVLGSQAVGKDARYHFSGEDGVRPNADYSVVLSTQENTTTSTLPKKWANSGEAVNSKSAVKDMTADGKINVHVLEKDVTEVDFALDKKPTADPKVVEIQVNPGGETKVPVPALSGNDAESGTKLRYMVKEVPENATLYNKGSIVSNNDFVTPNTLVLDPKDGKQIVTFSYVSIDPEGIKSDPVDVNMSFTGLSISGTIFEDFIIDGEVDSATTVAGGKTPLFISLLSEEGDVLASVPLLNDGTYLLDQTTGVNANTNYRLILSIEANVTTSTLVNRWNHADGENVNSLGKGNDGNPNGMIDVSVREIDLKQVDFGINYLLQ